jgi:hypothetical protein
MKIGLRLVTVAMLVAMPAMLVAPQVRAESTLNKILKEKKIRVAIEVGNPFDICDAPAVGIDSTAPDPTLRGHAGDGGEILRRLLHRITIESVPLPS